MGRDSKPAVRPKVAIKSQNGMFYHVPLTSLTTSQSSKSLKFWPRSGKLTKLTKLKKKLRKSQPPRLPFALPSGPVALWPWQTCNFFEVRNPKWLVDSCQPFFLNKVIAYHCPTYRIYRAWESKKSWNMLKSPRMRSGFTNASRPHHTAVLSAWQGQASHPSLKSPFFHGSKTHHLPMLVHQQHGDASTIPQHP